MPKFEFLVPGVPEGDAPVSTLAPPEIRSLTLDNGMRLIVWPDHDIPNVVLYNFVRAGSRNERPGATGIAHFFEHMMFNGTENLEPGEFDERMEAAGGANNAYTSNDLTVYQDWFPKSALETILFILARIAHRSGVSRSSPAKISWAMASDRSPQRMAIDSPKCFGSPRWYLFRCRSP